MGVKNPKIVWWNDKIKAAVRRKETAWKVASGKKVAGTIRSLVSDKGLQLHCARILQDPFLIPVLPHVSETKIWTHGEKSKGLGLWVCR